MIGDERTLATPKWEVKEGRREFKPVSGSTTGLGMNTANLLLYAKHLFLSANDPRFRKHSFPWPCQNASWVSRCTTQRAPGWLLRRASAQEAPSRKPDGGGSQLMPLLHPKIDGVARDAHPPIEVASSTVVPDADFVQKKRRRGC
jgi:hypothetical protein